jgi:flagellar motility protein MotE (MotC chaperone)
MSLRFTPPGFVLAMLAFGSATVAAASPPVPAVVPAAAEPKRPVASTAPVPAVPAAASTPASAAPVVKPVAPASDAQRYCQNVAVAAADARFALQTRKLNQLEAQIAERVADLEAKEVELKDMLARRDEATKRAEATLVGIYAKMRPDAAAQQISALDDATAAAVLTGLNARQSSAILNEIAPDRAVKLVNTISGFVPPDGKKS